MTARLVYIMATYHHVTRHGRGVGLLYRALHDADTGEEVKRYGRCGCAWLRRYAEKQGWELVRSPTGRLPDPVPLQQPSREHA